MYLPTRHGLVLISRRKFLLLSFLWLIQPLGVIDVVTPNPSNSRVSVLILGQKPVNWVTINKIGCDEEYLNLLQSPSSLDSLVVQTKTCETSLVNKSQGLSIRWSETN